MSDEIRRRATSLGPAERYLLDQWARTVAEAFSDHLDGSLNYPYLVGSVARGEDWRDVDVRLLLDMADFENLTGGGDRLRLAALNVAFTLWGQRATGLPIDFQFQEVEAANAEHDGVRQALGLVPR